MRAPLSLNWLYADGDLQCIDRANLIDFDEFGGDIFMPFFWFAVNAFAVPSRTSCVVLSEGSDHS